MKDAKAAHEPIRPTYLLTRGSYDKPDKSEVLTADIPAYFGDLGEQYPAIFNQSTQVYYFALA